MFKSISEFGAKLTTDASGQFSHTKLWSNIGYLTATFIMLKLTYNSKLTEDYFAIYLGVMAGHTVASKWLTAKEDPKGPPQNG